MLKRFPTWLFIAVVVLLPISLFAVVNWYEKSVQKLPILSKKNQTIASFTLINQNGSTTTLNDWDDKIVVADFFFTHCPVICPKMTKGLKKVQQAYAGDTELLINSFSVDPERDSATRLKSYIKKFGIDEANWQLITGDKREIYRLARNSFMIVATDGDGGPNDFIHSERLILIDQQKRIRGYYSGTNETEVNQLITDIKKLKNEN